MKSKLIILSLFFGGLLYSQNIEWENVYPNYLTNGKMIAIDSQDDIISVGNGLNVSGFANYLYTQKLDTDGNVIWKDSIATNVSNNYHSASWVGTDSQDNILIVGYRFILSSQNEVPNALKLIKYSSSGALLFNNTIDGVFNSGDISGLGTRNWAEFDENDNLYVASAGISDVLNQAGLILMKFDINCNMLWERVQTFSNIHALRGMDYNNERIALTGYSVIGGTNNKSAVWDASGNLIWSGPSTGMNQSWSTDIILDNDGYTYTLSQKYPGSYYDIDLTKYDLTGSVVFNKTYTFQIDSTPGRLILLPNNNIVLTATNWATSGVGNLRVLEVSKTNGDQISATSHTLPQINNWTYDIKMSSTGNYYITGMTNNNGGSPSEIFLYAFSEANGYEWQTTYNTNAAEPMAIALDRQEQIFMVTRNKYTVIKFANPLGNLGVEEFQKDGLRLYPNPVSDKLFINIDKSEINQFFIYDLLGNVVTYSNLFNEFIDVEKLPSGIFLLKLNTKSNESVSIKFIKQ